MLQYVLQTSLFTMLMTYETKHPIAQMYLLIEKIKHMHDVYN